MQDLKVLYITSWFPLKNAPNRCVFFREQIVLISKSLNVSILEVETVPIFKIKKIFAKNSLKVEKQGNYNIYRIQIYRVPPKRMKLRNKYLNKVVCVNYKKVILKEQKFDLIHVHAMWPGGLFGYFISKKFGLPMVVTEHASYLESLFRKESYKSNIEKIVNQTLQFFAVGSKLKKMFSNFNIDNCDVIPNFINFEKFTYIRKRTSNDDVFSLAIIGNINSKIKGPDVILKALNKVVNEYNCKSIVLNVVGTKRLDDEFIEYIAKNNLDHNVKLQGYIPNDALPEFLSNMDALVISSRKETFSIAGIEAMATGIPVVSTRCGGPEDYIIDGFNGYLVDNENYEELAKSICKIIQEYDKFDLPEIKKHAYNNYSHDAVIPKQLEYYNNILSKE
ncbi:MAG: hypothetical protein C0599_05435 [Salinivirgaceae bacterium]|nr:MAG: hypothetical protein C0599_05435 [Salinivirgaceae bacterium]